MPPLRIQIAWADGRSIERLFDSESIIVGSGPEASMQILDAPEVASAHLLVMPRAKECWVSGVREAKVPVMYAGKVFENGLLPFGAELDIGSVTVRLLRPASGGGIPWKRFPLVAGLAAVGYLMLPKDAGSLPRSDEDAPALFAAMSGSCPEEQRAQARAVEAVAAADAREIRYSFDRAEGVAAVGQLRIAELCAKRAQNGDLVREVQTRRLGLEARIDSDYKALRLTLDRAVLRHDLITIVQSSQQMRRLLGHRPGRYLIWLSELQRKATDQLVKNGTLPQVPK